MKKIFILLILVLLIIVSCFFYYKEGTMPVAEKNKNTSIFVINKGDNVNEIAKKLEKNGFIRSKLVFYFVVKQLGIDTKIQAGDFRLSPSMNIYEIAKSLTKGSLDTWVTVIEGLRKEEIAQIISKELSIPENEFIKVASEGFLFPDTYLVPKDATPETIIKIFENNFNQKYTTELKNKATQKGLSLQKVLTIASLVEREARSEKARLEVASIILKRYKNDWKLQIDATVQYALGYQSNEKTWWKTNLTYDDLQIASKYNTYKYEGLPPGPICNPGISSIMAVVNANENTPYWYYITDRNGNMHYAITDEEHNANIEKYLN